MLNTTTNINNCTSNALNRSLDPLDGHATASPAATTNSSREIMPGAFYERHRAVGELPAWAPARTVAAMTPSTATYSSSCADSVNNAATVPFETHPTRILVTSHANENRTTNSRQMEEREGTEPMSPPTPVRTNSRPLLRRSSRLLRSSGESSSQGRRGGGRHRHSQQWNRISHLFRSGSLVEAEAIHAEKVVYAVVQGEMNDEEDDDGILSMMHWEFLLVAILFLMVGMAIGRVTAPTGSCPCTDRSYSAWPSVHPDNETSCLNKFLPG